jgi:ComF family protein
MIKEFVNWLLPHKCLICNCETIEDSVFCAQCFFLVVLVDYPFCKMCGKMFETSIMEGDLCETCSTFRKKFNFARALFLYNHVSKQVIMKIKKQSDNETARKCCKMIFSKYKDLFKSANLIVPVPSHWTRILKRGYNPASIIAIELSKISNIQYCNVLKRIRKTDYQKNKTIQERIENVKGAFFCRKDLSDQTVILVDDVFTTGATLNECSDSLKKSGCREVICFTLATTGQ